MEQQAGSSNAPGTSAIDANPPPSGWCVWFHCPAGETSTATMGAAARLVQRDCRSRGVDADLLELPNPDDADLVGRLKNGAAVIVLSHELPPCVLPHQRLLVVGAETAEGNFRTVTLSPDLPAPDAALRILQEMESAGLLSSADDEVYSPAEEERLAKALDDLGYL